MRDEIERLLGDIVIGIHQERGQFRDEVCPGREVLDRDRAAGVGRAVMMRRSR